MGQFDHLIGRELARRTVAWTPDRAMLYAVGVGAGLFEASEELAFTTENTEGQPQQVLPSFLTLLGTGGEWIKLFGFEAREWEGLDWDWPKGLVIGEQGVALTRPLPPGGEAEVSLVVSGVYDKGAGALLVADTEVRLSGTGELLGTGRSGMYVRGQGGFGGPRAPEGEPAWIRPERAPDAVVTLPTLPGQALIFRHLGDHNPHCTDPARARADGFEGPILQGQGAFGFGCRALLKGLCEGDVARFGAMHARFAKPLYPGETLRTLIWRTGDGAVFQTLTAEGKVVLDRGVFGFAG
jgi:acyl dehydratase